MKCEIDTVLPSRKVDRIIREWWRRSMRYALCNGKWMDARYYADCIYTAHNDGRRDRSVAAILR